MEKFPFPAPELGAVLDPNELLSPEETAAITSKVHKLEKRLPQVRFLNCFVPLGEKVNLREFGFWLFNAGQLKGGDDAKTFAVLFLLDPKQKNVSITVGYGLDPLVMDTEWVTLCDNSRDLFFRQKYQQGIERFLDGAVDLLAERALTLKKELKK